MKKMNNNGFSLVELIVVIAIMAILVGVLAPSVLGQLDKAKISKDKQSVETVVTAIATAYADQTVTDSKPTGSGDQTVTAVAVGASQTNATYSGTGNETAFDAAVQEIVGYSAIKLESNAYSAATVSFKLNTTTGKVTGEVTGASPSSANFTVVR